MSWQKSLHEEALDRSTVRYMNFGGEYSRRWAYQAAYEAVVQRLRQAAHRGAVSGAEEERVYWQETKKIAEEKLEELEVGRSAVDPERRE